uniref:Uncharacterized protein n=1 Tax=Anguilla anguilla TaxID=7936 RepID=A0A0E9V5Z6_ANGAN
MLLAISFLCTQFWLNHIALTYETWQLGRQCLPLAADFGTIGHLVASSLIWISSFQTIITGRV